MTSDVSRNIISKKCLVTSYVVSYQLADDDIKTIIIPNEHDYVLDNRNLNKISQEAIEKLTGLKPKKILKNKLMFGTCPLCDQHKELKRSHVIGASIFSKLLKTSPMNTGVLVSMNQKEIKLSNDNWTSYMLCNACEGHFNSNYEDYSIHALRNEIEGLSCVTTEQGLNYNNIDSNKIILYVLSIYWRGALSIAPSYNKILMTNGMNENLKGVFLNKYYYDSNVFKIRICKLIDETKEVDEVKMKYFIICPFVRMVDKGLVYCFVFEGLLFQLFMNCNESLERDNISGIVDNQSSSILMPYVDFCDVSEIRKVLQQGVELVTQDEKISSICLKEAGF